MPQPIDSLALVSEVDPQQVPGREGGAGKRPTAERGGTHPQPLTDPGSTLAGVRYCTVALVGAGVGLTGHGSTSAG